MQARNFSEQDVFVADLVMNAAGTLHFDVVTTRQCFGDENIANESVRYIFLVAQERAAVAAREGSSANLATKRSNWKIDRFFDLLGN